MKFIVDNAGVIAGIVTVVSILIYGYITIRNENKKNIKGKK